MLHHIFCVCGFRFPGGCYCFFFETCIGKSLLSVFSTIPVVKEIPSGLLDKTVKQQWSQVFQCLWLWETCGAISQPGPNASVTFGRGAVWQIICCSVLFLGNASVYVSFPEALLKPPFFCRVRPSLDLVLSTDLILDPFLSKTPANNWAYPHYLDPHVISVAMKYFCKLFLVHRTWSQMLYSCFLFFFFYSII